MGDCNQALEQAPFDFLRGEAGYQSTLGDLLPMCLTLVRKHFGKLSEAKLECVVGLVNGLNFLFMAGWSSHPILPSAKGPLTPVQIASLEHFALVVEYFFDKPPVPFSFEEVTKFLS